MEKRVIVIVGPTCSGKSDVAIKLADKLDTEIISADSRQIYKYLDIGTAKPSPNELKKIEHHFINHLNPDEDYNVSKFEHEALNVIEQLFSRNKIPIVVGGSGLYIKGLVDGIVDEVGRDEEYREQLMSLRKENGNEYLFEMLKKVDPESAGKMLPQNWKRVIRALEVFHISGKTINELYDSQTREVDFKFVQFGLRWERAELYRRIEARVDEMIIAGLVGEVKSLLERGYNQSLNSLNTVGYKEIIDHLNGLITLERAIELIKRNTRRYAKRQMTWFRKDERITWFDITSEEDLINTASKIISYFNKFEQ